MTDTELINALARDLSLEGSMVRSKSLKLQSKSTESGVVRYRAGDARWGSNLREALEKLAAMRTAHPWE